MGPGDLSRVLAGLPAQRDARLIVGRETFDDAGVFLLTADLALVQTVDFFAPIVDDPFTFGQVAAANALSDVYAMGGEPMTALNIVGFPTGKLPSEVLTAILRGGQEIVHEAGAIIVGGHTVTDEEVKYGLAVTGRVHPDRLLTNAGAAEGDRLFLTKPIGTGILATSAKAGRLDATTERGMLDSMRTLNRDASRGAIAVGARCATDITGFGLLGHASHIARASGVTLTISAGLVPVLDGARAAWSQGARTGGAERNEEYLEKLVEWGTADTVTRALLVDPQTSGGLLVAVPAARAGEFADRVAGAVAIGEVVERRHAPIVIT
ncbi:MAG: selenide, water dikinase SelD [Gemmatimonadaceae bacterium]